MADDVATTAAVAALIASYVAKLSLLASCGMSMSDTIKYLHRFVCVCVCVRERERERERERDFVNETPFFWRYTGSRMYRHLHYRT